jgi:outer membrane immunogenic protein
MRNVVRLISAGVIAAFGSASVLAADLPSRRPPPPLPAVAPVPFNWTGCHVGVNAGFAYDDYHFAVFATDPVLGGFVARNKVYTSGPLGGGQVGCDYQLPWNIVIGAEADFDGAAVHGSKAIVAPLAGGPAGFLGGVSTATRVNAFGSLRFRVGYAFDHFFFMDNFLVYLTAGVAYGSIRDTATAFAGPNSATWTRSRNPFGAGKEPGVVGIGIEKMITPNLSVDLTYHYHYMGASTPVISLFPAGQAGFGTRSMYHIARVGLNYHFGWGAPAPVVARY